MQDDGIKFSVGLRARHAWANGKPVKSEQLSDGKTRHLLEDGRTITVHEPTYRLEYLSTWLGADPDETYDINIAIIGLSLAQGFYEVWNFDIGEARNYSFSKTHRIVDLKTGQEFTGQELRDSLARS
jgi:hypothetical protein